MSHACGCATICVYHGELVPKSHIATLTAENKKLREVVKWHADAGDRMSFDCLAELDG